MASKLVTDISLFKRAAGAEMASKLVFSVLLFTVVVAAVATLDVTDNCRVGMYIEYDPLRGCREYIARRCGVAPEHDPALSRAKARCCRELGPPMPETCRCDALSILVNGVITEEGVRVGRMEALRGCTRERIVEMAAALQTPAECNLETKTSAPAAVCPLWGGGMD